MNACAGNYVSTDAREHVTPALSVLGGAQERGRAGMHVSTVARMHVQLVSSIQHPVFVQNSLTSTEEHTSTYAGVPFPCKFKAPTPSNTPNSIQQHETI